MKRIQFPGLLVVICSICSNSEPATAAGLDEPSAEDRARIEKCLNDADGLEENCITSISDACLALPGGETTVGISECFRRETKIWDDMLNRNFQDLKKTMSREEFTALREVQRTWIRYRDLKCRYPYTVIKGTMASSFASSCMNTETARRAIDLKRWRDWGNQ